MANTISVNRFSVLTGIPESTKGLVRELRVRWALEEMGLPYEEICYPHPETKKEEYLKKQPFGQVPYFTSGDLCMFESGAILLHLALKHNKLLPTDEIERAHTFTWMFAALNSVESWMFHYFLLKNDPDASDATKTKAKQLVESRLHAISDVLGKRDFFGEGFSIAEIIITTVLKTAQHLKMLGDFENLSRYVERNESRPAFKRALGEHEKLYIKKTI
ncbi:MAG TPA: glutathione S-transferase family protein [Bacteriovoracaceae bacterium]|nr:glutathione S-transferase family protein [Bacteriovoracaceae bacterium]